jgi:hypothetical protein
MYVCNSIVKNVYKYTRCKLCISWKIHNKGVIGTLKYTVPGFRSGRLDKGPHTIVVLSGTRDSSGFGDGTSLALRQARLHC